MFQINWDRSSWVEPVLSKDKMCLAEGHNTAMPVRFEPAAPLSQVKHSTTEPMLSHRYLCMQAAKALARLGE